MAIGIVEAGALACPLPRAGKMRVGIPVRHPIAAEELICFRRQGNIPVLGALAAMDVDHHPLAVDIGDLQSERFRDPQAAGVDGGKASVVRAICDVTRFKRLATKY